jgi:pimeloyl-ACP methyl ester carboxylesterase
VSSSHPRTSRPHGAETRSGELARVSVPTLVIDTPEDPINPPPHAAHLAALVRGASRTAIPGMGHALSTPVLEPLAEAILTPRNPLTVHRWTRIMVDYRLGCQRRRVLSTTRA